jgi:hypothetical protein
VHRHALAAGMAAVGIGLAGAMVAITPAMAGPVSVRGITTQTVIATATAAATETGEAEATCPAGELLTGGGYTISGTSTDWQVYVDAPANSTTWLVEPVNFAAQPLDFSAYAICAESVPGKKGVSAYTSQVVATTVTVPANQTGEADATCPAGDLLTGGGYQVENISPNWSIYLNAPTASGTWTAEIDNEVPLSTTYDSFAICLGRKNSKPVTALTTSTVSTASTVPANSSQTADVSCGAHQLMTGGGYVMDSIGQDWLIAASAPVTSNDWQVEAVDLDSVSRDFDSIAMCLAKA